MHIYFIQDSLLTLEIHFLELIFILNLFLLILFQTKFKLKIKKH